MMTETIEELNKAYPGWHLHCEVAVAGTNSYKVVMSLTNADGDQIASVTHFGSGRLNDVKDAAFDRLYGMLNLINA